MSNGSDKWASMYHFNKLENEILKAIDAENGNFIGFKALSKNLGIPYEVVAGFVRNLKERGYVHYARGLMNDDGQLAGSGYAFTTQGLDYKYVQLKE